MTTGGERGDHTLERQLERYYVRFNDDFWAFFEAEIRPRLPSEPTLVDVGSGPGLYLRDVSTLLPAAKLHGIDRAEDMLDNARLLSYAGAPPALTLHDATTGRLPLDDGTVDLMTIAAVMHAFDDPFAFLDEARRVLAPHGMLLVYDWIRIPLKEYIAYREREPGDPPEVRYPRALQMFGSHNKYSADDWRWLLAQARYEIIASASPYPRAQAFLTRPG